MSVTSWWGEVITISVVVLAVVFHFLFWHFRQSRRKYVENHKIIIKEIVQPQKQDFSHIAAMTKQSMLFAFPLVAVGTSITDEEKVPFIGKSGEDV